LKKLADNGGGFGIVGSPGTFDPDLPQYADAPAFLKCIDDAMNLMGKDRTRFFMGPGGWCLLTLLLTLSHSLCIAGSMPKVSIRLIEPWKRKLFPYFPDFVDANQLPLQFIRLVSACGCVTS
jgi:hypothetical protein